MQNNMDYVLYVKNFTFNALMKLFAKSLLILKREVN